MKKIVWRIISLPIFLILIISICILSYGPIKKYLYLNNVKKRIQMASSLANEGKNDLALKSYTLILDELIRNKEVSYLSAVFNGLGNIYLSLAIKNNNEKDFKESIKYFNDALGGYTQKAYPKIYGSIDCNLGIAFKNLWRISHNKQYLLKALEYYNDAYDTLDYVKDFNGCVEVDNNLGVLYHNLAKIEDSENNYKLAINAYQNARLLIKEKTKDYYSQGVVIYNEAQSFKEMSEIRDKIINLKIAFALYAEALNIFTVEYSPGYHDVIKKKQDEIRKLLRNSV